MKKKKFIQTFSSFVFFILGCLFMLVALVIVGVSVWDLFNPKCENCVLLIELLSFVGYLIIAVAVFDVGVYLLEEQAFKERQTRSPREARRSLTKFMVIIVIAISLDALLNVLKASSTDVRLLIYPAALVLVAVFLLVGLGAYQWLSSLTEAQEE